VAKYSEDLAGAPLVIDVSDDKPAVAFTYARVLEERLKFDDRDPSWSTSGWPVVCNVSRDRLGVLVERHHDVPHPLCTCGLHAHVRPQEPIPWGDENIGVTCVLEVWDRVAVFDGGVRTARASVRAIAPPPGVGAVERRAVVAAARADGIDHVERRQLLTYARSIGTLLPVIPAAAPQRLTARRDTAQIPRFRFHFEPSGGTITPWEPDDPVLGDPAITHPQLAAVGDVFALDDDRALAVFAHVPQAARARAEAELRDWARADGWQLRIARGLQPLARPTTPYVTSGATLSCGGCQWTFTWNWMSGPSRMRRGWLKTRCPACGGRCAFTHPTIATNAKGGQ
jgi:hypothetical protein